MSMCCFCDPLVKHKSSAHSFLPSASGPGVHLMYDCRVMNQAMPHARAELSLVFEQPRLAWPSHPGGHHLTCQCPLSKGQSQPHRRQGVPTQRRTGLAYDSHQVTRVLVPPLPLLEGLAVSLWAIWSFSVKWGQRGFRQEVQDLFQ